MARVTRCLAVLGVCAVLAGTGAATGAQDVGTVVGVDLDDGALRYYRLALTDTNHYLQGTYGTGFTNAVTVRVYGTTDAFVRSLTKYFRTEASARENAKWTNGWAGDREVLLNHSGLQENYLQYQAAAHELTHEWQVEQAGFDTYYSDRAWNSCWMAEGHAEFVGWKVGDPVQITSYSKAHRYALTVLSKAPRFSLRQAPGACDQFRPLQARLGWAAYWMSMLAVEALTTRAEPAAVRMYFRALASQPFADAFKRSFKISMDEFLAEFDAQISKELGR